MIHPFDDPSDIAYRPPLDRSLPFPPAGEVDHPHLKELLYANLGADQVVVDVGCGPGPFEYESYAPRFVAFDAFDVVTREGLKAGRDEFRLGELDTIPIDDESCDAVILGFILEHVRNPVRFLEEADRVLKPGGWCYIAIPNGTSIEDRLFRLATALAGSRRGPHIQKFTFKKFVALAEERTRLRLVAWHFLPAAFLYLDRRGLRLVRRGLIGGLKGVRRLGLDALREADYQLLFRKETKSRPGHDNQTGTSNR